MTDNDQNDLTYFYYHKNDMQIDGMTRDEAVAAINNAFDKAEAKGGLDLRLRVEYGEDYYELWITGKRKKTEQDRLQAQQQAEDVRKYRMIQYENLKKELGIE